MGQIVFSAIALVSWEDYSGLGGLHERVPSAFPRSISSGKVSSSRAPNEDWVDAIRNSSRE
eukprot:scaffold6565_cov93-Cylindrotheca_fusiformis.AAC.3